MELLIAYWACRYVGGNPKKIILIDNHLDTRFYISATLV
jgi:hypothetical protein